MQDNVVIVTGATNGLGEVTALELARKGAEVVLVSRTQSKLDASVNKIKAATGNQNVSSIQADLSSMDEVRKVAQTFLQTHDRLDVLVNNAGAFFMERETTVDGFEKTFALNHLNYFLLTHLLMDTLRQTAQQQGEARIVNVASNAHQPAKLNFDDLQHEKGYSGFGAYGESKLMNIMFTYELARRIEGTGVTANALHPGLVRTGFGHNNGFITKIVVSLLQIFGKTVEDGASTQIYLASAPEVKGINGKYWDNSKQTESNAISYDEDAQKRLWAISEELTGIDEPVTA